MKKVHIQKHRKVFICSPFRPKGSTARQKAEDLRHNRQLASLENRVRQIEKGFANEIVVEEVIHGELAGVIGRINAEASVSTGTSGAFVITEPVRLELTGMP